MATYPMIRQAVKEADGFYVKNCWIAHVKAMNRLTSRVAHDATKGRKNPCPPKKQAAIKRALRKLGAI